jgi:hypothetical protein
VGVAFTNSVFTLDFRYFDTDLSNAECFINTGDLRGLASGTRPATFQSNWCNSAFIVTSKFDITAGKDLK